MKKYNTNVVAQFEEQVLKTANDVAVWCHNQTYTYQQLNASANCIANELLHRDIEKHGVAQLRDQCIVIYLKTGFSFIQSMWGALKAGAAYVPIDTATPAERVRFIIEETQASYIITTAELYNQIQLDTNTIPAIFLDDLNSNNTNNPNIPIALDALAYVLYTSGSSGTPKGVMIEHRGLASSILAKLDYYKDANENSLLLTSVGFDSSISTIYWPLLSGGKLTIPSDNAYQNPALLVDFIYEQAITHLLCTPSLYRLLLDAFDPNKSSALKQVVVAGEVCKPTILDKHCRLLPDTSLSNEYGPTEASIWSTACCLFDRHTQVRAEHVTIGHSAPHVVNAIVDNELFIGGPCLARGYINRPDETRKQFISKHVAGFETTRWYKTGDRCELSESGAFVFLGRLDNQIKVNGVRIETAEIESVILSCEEVEEAVVRLIKQCEWQRLVAFVTGDVDVKRIENRLSDTLPPAMLPNAIVPLSSIPLNQNGKIDEAALVNALRPATQQTMKLPKDPIESQIHQIWQSVLGINDIIDVNRHFFSLGGHSLLMVRVVMQINKALQSKLTIKDFLNNDTIRGLAQTVKQMTHEQQALLRPATRQAHMPATQVQKRLWFLHHYYQGESLHYNVPIAFRFTGSLNVKALEHALNRLLIEHEILRTVFAYAENGLSQVIHPYTPLTLAVVATDANHINDQLVQTARHVFDLVSGPLTVFTLFKLTLTEHILLINQHHIVHDGHCTNILFHDIVKHYHGYQIQKPLDTSTNELQYADYAVWEKSELQPTQHNDDFLYWQKQLQGFSALNIPLDSTRPAQMTYEGDQIHFKLTTKQFVRLKKLRQDTGSSLFMLCLAAFYRLLSIYSSQDDLIVGSAVSLRDQSQTHHILGPFTNTLPLRIQINNDDTLRVFIDAVKHMCVDAFSHKTLPFEQIIESLSLKRLVDRMPLFQHMIIYNHLTFSQNDKLGNDVDIQVDFVSTQTSKYDFTLTLNETNDALSGFIEYNTILFEKETIAQMIEHFKMLLERMPDSLELPLQKISSLTPRDVRILLHEWNGTEWVNDKLNVIHARFEKHAAKNPNKIAVICGDHSLSYDTLNKRANQVARYLVQKGATTESLVAISLHRSVNLAVCLMAILKVGASYVPLDPAYPAERLQYMLAHSNAGLLITEHDIQKNLGLHCTGRVIYIEELIEEIKTIPSDNLCINVAENLRVLVHYTSGSTGKPKGVMLAHGDLCYCFEWLDEAFPLSESGATLQHTKYSFDVFICELFWPLIKGRTSVFLEAHRENDMPHIINTLEKHPIEHLFCVPSTLTLLLEHEDFSKLSFLKNILSTGEALPLSLKNEFYEKTQMTLYNLYGPTESTIFTSYTICKKDTSSITIGKPVTNKKVLVLDQDLTLLPIGVIGDLYIGGRVGMGYYNQPELTAKNFFYHEIDGRQYRLYRSGDLARYLHSGDVQYLGRSDHQIKFHGYRIEPAEIEILLDSFEEIKKSVVCLTNVNDTQALVAYYQTYNQEDTICTHDARKMLAASIPHYMIPSYFMRIDTFPLTPSGKVDRKSLPSVQPDDIQFAHQYVAPRNDIEFALMIIFEKLLGVSRIGIRDNFFDLGGNSLLAVQCVVDIKNKLGKTLPVSFLFTDGTIEAISQQFQLSVRDLHADVLLPIQVNDSAQKIFWAHPVEGLAYLYMPLRSHMRDYSLYGLSNPHFYDRSTTFASIEEMAACYIASIQSIQPNGPYILCGWSSGGQIAYEMACQLRSQNHQVEAVILLDTYHNDLNIIEEDLSTRIPRVLEAEGIDPNSEEGSYFDAEYRQNMKLIKQYQSPIYDGRVALIKAEIVDKNIENHPNNRWQPYVARPIEVYSTPGEHGRLLDNQYISSTVQRLYQVLERSTLQVEVTMDSSNTI